MNRSYLKYDECSSTKSDVLHFADHLKYNNPKLLQCGHSYCVHYFLNTVFQKKLFF